MDKIESRTLASQDIDNGPYLVVTIPNFGCCHCENRLRPRFGGLCILKHPSPFPLMFLVCESCLSAGLQILENGGTEVRSRSPKAIQALLDDENRVAGFAQARCGGGFVLLEPIPPGNDKPSESSSKGGLLLMRIELGDADKKEGQP
jgi:hypothetical protein